MFRTIIDAFKVKEIRNKILLTLLFLFIYRLGCWIPCIGFNSSVVLEGSNGLGFFDLMNLVSGGALTNCSVLALGVSPYITASIVIQLLTIAIPALERLSKSGEDGRRKISLYTRFVALALAIAQSVGIVVGYANVEGGFDPNLTAVMPKWLIGMGVVIIMVAGAMFTVWMGERITELGIGNGTSLLIFVGILSSAGSAVSKIVRLCTTDITYIWYLVLFFVIIVAIFALIVLMDGGERKVTVDYAKQMKGRKMYGGQKQSIPIKVNATGVMPIIFASALLTFPQMIISIFWPHVTWYSDWLGTNSWLYIVLTAILILAFAFFYSKISFDTKDIAKRLQQQGGLIQGIRQGKPTADYLSKISDRITFWGALFLAIIALLPSLAFKAIGDFSGGPIVATLINAFSVTGLMIVVSVALELDKQLSAQMMIRNHKGFLS